MIETEVRRQKTEDGSQKLRSETTKSRAAGSEAKNFGLRTPDFKP